MNRRNITLVAFGLLVLAVSLYVYTRPGRVTVDLGRPPKQLNPSSTVQSLNLSEAVDALAYLPSGNELVVLTYSQSSGKGKTRHLLKCRFDSEESVQLLATHETLIGLAVNSDGSIAYTGQWRTGPDKVCELLQVNIHEGRSRSKFTGPPLEGFGFRITSDPTALGIDQSGRYVAGGFKLVDNEHIAGGHIGGEVCVWDTETGDILWRNRNVHTNTVRSVVFSTDGERLFSAGDDSLIRIWDAQEGELLGTLTGVLWDGVASMATSPDGRYLATGGQGREEGGRVRVWDLQEKALLRILSPFRLNSHVRVAFCRSGELVAAGQAKSSAAESPKFELRAWQAGTFAPAGLIGNGDGFVRALATSPSGQAVAVGTFEGQILRYDFEITDGITKP